MPNRQEMPHPKGEATRTTARRPVSRRAAFHRRAFADRLRAARSFPPKVGQEELAFRIGCDRRTIIRIEKGEVPITLELVEAVADALGLEPADFLGSLTLGRMDEETWRREMRDAVTTLHQRVVNTTKAALSRDVVMRLFMPLANLPDEEIAVITSWLNSRVRDLYETRPAPDGRMTITASTSPPMFPRRRLDGEAADEPAGP
jgi:transcriptional regulator with XRE-family HTH domain